MPRPGCWKPGSACARATARGHRPEGDKFHVFTSSTEFEPDVAYSKFAVYAILEHDGDWSGAAAQLARDGYASREAVCAMPPAAAEATWAPPRSISGADRTNYMSLLFTPLLRHYVAQLLSPRFVITATAQGSGKTYLVDVPKALFGATVRPWVGDDEELRKAITATLRETNPLIVFDDVDRWDSVGSATFCKALTQYEWDDRLLGLNKEFRGRNDRAWVIMGNNVTLGADVPDRADGLVRLDPHMPDPKNRPVAGFAVGDLREWLKDPANCPLVLRHLLVLVLDWAQAGAPEKAYPSRFPKWAAIMGGLLGHHGFTDFLGNAAAIREQHSETARSLQSFLARWYATFGSTPQRLRPLCQERSYEWGDVRGLPTRECRPE